MITPNDKAAAEGYAAQMDELPPPDKIRARQLASNARVSGKLSPKPCEVCGAQQVEMHHEDYSKPLDVTWLCKKHHYERHGYVYLGAPWKALGITKSAAYSKRRNHKRREAGLCTVCGAPANGFQMCDKHRRIKLENAHKRYEKRIAAGLCIYCDAPLVTETLCEQHRQKHNATSSIRYYSTKDT